MKTNRTSLFRWLWLGLFLAWVTPAHAESQAASVSSGISLGSDGLKVSNPQGSGLGITFDGRFISSEISVLGKGKTNGAGELPPRILAPVQTIDLSRSTGMTNPDVFFRNIGKPEQPTPSYRRPSTLR